MAIKLSIFTTTTNPIARGDNYEDAFRCYGELADEVVIVDGSNTNKSEDWLTEGHFKYGYYKWPKEFDWRFIGQQFQRGYEACTGDWVIHADLDFIFHEKDFADIRKVLEQYNDLPALSFYKYQFILPDRYNLKSRLVIAVNKGRYGDKIRFDSGGDFAQPSLEGRYISPDSVPESKIGFYNYEKLLKTKEQIAEDQGRMERAWYKSFGYYQMKSDGTNNGAYQKWYEAQKGKFNKPQQTVALKEHPKYIIETISNLKPENFGYNGFGLIDRRVYS